MKWGVFEDLELYGILKADWEKKQTRDAFQGNLLPNKNP
jgi:hypothetical protein